MTKPTKDDGAPGNFNFWGERSNPEYFLLKQSFGTCTRGMPATKGRFGALFCLTDVTIRKFLSTIRKKMLYLFVHIKKKQYLCRNFYIFYAYDEEK